MREFKIIFDFDENEYYINSVFNKYKHRAIQIDSIKTFYKELTKEYIIDIMNKHNGYNQSVDTNAICFTTDQEAQNFIDELLLPCEMAYNL